MNSEVDLRLYHPYEIQGLERIGNKHDGGYVVHLPSLQQTDCLLNYGVGYNIIFEEKYHQLTGKPVYAFDPTLKSVSYVLNEFKSGEYYTGSKHLFRMMMWLVREKTLHRKGIRFVEEGLAGRNTERFKTLGYHIEKYHLKSKQLFLKIDIEGAEYEVLQDDDFYTHLPNVTQMVFEFHYLKDKLTELNNIMKRLLQTHTLVHIHANNNGGVFDKNGKKVPEIIEVVFLNHSILPEPKLSQSVYPIEDLDYPCNWRRKDIVLDFFK